MFLYYYFGIIFITHKPLLVHVVADDVKLLLSGVFLIFLFPFSCLISVILSGLA